MFHLHYHEALNYFYEGKRLAEQSGSDHDYFLASTHVSIARCLRDCGQYAEAERYLKEIHPYAEKTNNNYILTFILFNLTIVYLRWGRIKQGMDQYKTLCELRTRLNTSYLTLCFDEIREEFPFVDDHTLNERQLRGLIHLQTHKKLTRQQYTELNGVGKTVAQDDLGMLVAGGLCERHGRGRGVHYKLVGLAA